MLTYTHLSALNYLYKFNIFSSLKFSSHLTDKQALSKSIGNAYK